MSEIDQIMAVRRHSSAVRLLARFARTGPAAIKADAVGFLLACRFLKTSDPSDDDLEKIEAMTDTEIVAVLKDALP